MTHQLRLLICCIVTLAHGFVLAQISPEAGEILTRKSGAWAQLADTAQQVKAGIAQSPLRSMLTSEDVGRMEKAADEAYAAQNLRADLIQGLSSKLGESESRAALRWYDSPVGRRITQIEEAGSASMKDFNTTLQHGNRILAGASERRQALVARIVKASHFSEGIVAMQINSAIGVAEGVTATLPDQPKSALEEFRAAMESQRATMVASMSGIGMALFASMYQSVTDRELEQYSAFMTSRSGAGFMEVMTQALNQALSNAARIFGERVAAAKKAGSGASPGARI